MSEIDRFIIADYLTKINSESLVVNPEDIGVDIDYTTEPKQMIYFYRGGYRSKYIYISTIYTRPKLESLIDTGRRYRHIHVLELSKDPRKNMSNYNIDVEIQDVDSEMRIEGVKLLNYSKPVIDRYLRDNGIEDYTYDVENCYIGAVYSVKYRIPRYDDQDSYNTFTSFRIDQNFFNGIEQCIFTKMEKLFRCRIDIHNNDLYINADITRKRKSGRRHETYYSRKRYTLADLKMTDITNLFIDMRGYESVSMFN